MHRFDSLSRSLSSRFSRRSTILGVAATVAGGAGLDVVRASAQGVAPTASSAASPVATDTDNSSFLFVQSASSATYAQPNPNSGHRLTLKGHTGGTVFFSDRPERIFGEAPTQAFLDGLGFEAGDPPNAAIVTTNEDGTGDVLIVELTDPVYNAASGELSYSVSALETYTGDGLAFVASQQHDLTLAPELGSTSLFIDDCSNGTAYCFTSDNCLGSISYGRCWDWGDFDCKPCDDVYTLNDQCNRTYSGCSGECVAETNAGCDA